MLLKIRLFSATIATSFLLILVLCLGSQNLRTRYSLNLGIGKTAPLPIGFILGISLSLGVLSGGSTTTLLIPTKEADL